MDIIVDEKKSSKITVSVFGLYKLATTMLVLFNSSNISGITTMETRKNLLENLIEEPQYEAIEILKFNHLQEYYENIDSFHNSTERLLSLKENTYAYQLEQLNIMYLFESLLDSEHQLLLNVGFTIHNLSSSIIEMKKGISKQIEINKSYKYDSISNYISYANMGHNYVSSDAVRSLATTYELITYLRTQEQLPEKYQYFIDTEKSLTKLMITIDMLQNRNITQVKDYRQSLIGQYTDMKYSYNMFSKLMKVYCRLIAYRIERESQNSHYRN